MSTREIEHAALQWHAAHAHRMALNAQRLALEKDIRAHNLAFKTRHPEYWALGGVKNQITAAKQKERAALKVLAKACTAQRTHLARADIIDVDVKQLASASITTEGGNAS